MSCNEEKKADYTFTKKSDYACVYPKSNHNLDGVIPINCSNKETYMYGVYGAGFGSDYNRWCEINSIIKYGLPAGIGDPRYFCG